MKLHAKTLLTRHVPITFRQISKPDNAEGINEETLPWAEIVESNPAGHSLHAEKLHRALFSDDHLPVPVMLSVITLVAILLYFLAQ